GRSQHGGIMKRRGFTLMEMILTISVTAILCGVAIGGYVGIRKWQTVSAIRRIDGDLAYARAAALLTSRRTQFAFDATATKYTLGQEAAPGTDTLTVSTMTNPQTGMAWSVTIASQAPSFSIASIANAPSNALGFDNDGTLIDASGVPFSNDVTI